MKLGRLGDRAGFQGAASFLAAFAVVVFASGPAGECWLAYPLIAAVGGAIGFLAARQLAGIVAPEAASRRWELLRWVFVAGAAFIASLPLRTAGQLGSGDAAWYTAVLADYVGQVRAGVFPVWIGQTEYAFNGAVFPLRVAPGIQHLAGALDLLTLRQLDVLQLKATLCALQFLAAASVSYYSFARIAGPANRSVGAVLGCLVVLSPASLAPLYLGDQLMQFLAFGLLPLAAALWVDWIEGKPDMKPWAWAVLLAAALWLHTPLAAWIGLLSILAFLVGATARRRFREDARFGFLLVLFLTLFAAYPVVSAHALDDLSTLRTDVNRLLAQVEAYSQNSLRPISPHNINDGAYQLGIPMLLVGAVGIVLAFVTRRRSGIVLASMILLLFPLTQWVPGITRFLWLGAPDLLVDVTNLWPHQRIIPLLAILIAALVAQLWPLLGGRARRFGWVLLTAAGLWSLQQASVVVGITASQTIPRERAKELADTRNVQLTRYSYYFFQKTPSYFSHGYMDPILENRLLLPGTGEVVSSNAEAAAPFVYGDHPRRVSSDVLTPHPSAGWAFAFDGTITLEAQVRYAFRLRLPPHLEGTLSLTGGGAFRDYELPDSGWDMPTPLPPAGFGVTPTSSPILPVSPIDGRGSPMKFSFFSIKPIPPPPLSYSLFRYTVEDLPASAHWFPTLRKSTPPSPSGLRRLASGPRAGKPAWVGRR